MNCKEFTMPQRNLRDTPSTKFNGMLDVINALIDFVPLSIVSTYSFISLDNNLKMSS
jgi:hypothetical protein